MKSLRNFLKPKALFSMKTKLRLEITATYSHGLTPAEMAQAKQRLSHVREIKCPNQNEVRRKRART
jgi:hypothetical protein